MSCYRPNIMIPTGSINVETGKPVYRFKARKDLSNDELVNASAYGYVTVPCGKCLGCRLDYSRNWADRMMLELETSKKAIFVTLTYNEDCVPVQLDNDGVCLGYTFDIRDWQKFMKLLRRRFKDKKLRFYTGFEYGPLNGRPHMHSIIFGIGLDDLIDKVPIGKNELKQIYYRSPIIESCWMEFKGKGKDRVPVKSKGFVSVSDVSWETCAYVARYVMKKAQPDQYGRVHGVKPEFALMSRNPGLGAEYLEMHPDCLDYQKISVPTAKGARQISIPKYYIRKCELTDPEKCAMLKEVRKCAAEDSMMLKMCSTSLSFLDQLEVEEEMRREHTNILKRMEL